MVSAAFADERDADLAVRMIASSAGLDILGYSRRMVLGERGEVQLVVLEVDLGDPRQASRVETCIAGAHGVRITANGAGDANGAG